MTTSENPLRAFHGKPAVKRKYLTRVRKHRSADDIVAGQYWEEDKYGRFKGCAVGCTLHSSNHSAYETELGIPTILARLEDRLFEGLHANSCKKEARLWPERFLAAIKPGADLSLVWPKFAHWMLVDEETGVIRHAKSERSREAIRGVAELFDRWQLGCKPSADDFKAARITAAAYAAYAAADAADAAAYAAAADAAYAAAAAADAAYAAAADAYAAAADAAYAADARKSRYLGMAEKLLEILAASK